MSVRASTLGVFLGPQAVLGASWAVLGLAWAISELS